MPAIRCFVALFLVLFIASTARAADEEAPLFNGKDLSGWTHFTPEPNVKMEDVWTVKDGVIHCTGKPTGFLKSKQTYKDLELTFDWRWPQKPGNSGVLLRTQEPDAIWPKSIEPQLMHQNAGDLHLLGGFTARPAGDASRLQNGRIRKLQPSNEKPAGEWNTYRIRLVGDKVELWVNGTKQNEAVRVDDVAGTISFQSEGAPIEFRNIKLVDLSGAGGGAGPDASTQASRSEKRRLPGLEGWHLLGKGNWTYKDGVIEGSQPESTKTYTHVVSDKSYKNFKASLKFKAVKGNSGFYFRVKPEGESKMLGIQAEIDEKNNVGGMYESYGRNWLSRPKEEEVAKFFKPGEWNDMTVEAHGPHVVVHVNGVKASEINDPSIRMEGPFALQIHGGQDVHVMFKDIHIQELP
ncbi:MAG TPA: DUF1080 domain-containing protein [Tepidisphaeraceae bacterium]|nr:DUF1080 domain-containing protein [Tepidisphaeraceae bacterium]